jgi:hypothetical protein
MIGLGTEIVLREPQAKIFDMSSPRDTFDFFKKYHFMFPKLLSTKYIAVFLRASYEKRPEKNGTQISDELWTIS